MAGIDTLAQDIGFASQGRICWGFIEGYWFGIVQGLQHNSAIHIYTAARFSETADKGAVSAVLETLRAAKTINSHTVFAYGYEMVITPGFTGIQSRKVAEAMHVLTGALRMQGAQPACFNCGSPEALSFAELNRLPLSLCDGCQTHFEETQRQREDAHALLPYNRALGVLGALLGALLGGAVWVGVGLLGYIAAIAGLAIAFFAAKGYTMFKGKLDRAAVVIICVVCLVVFALAQFATMDAILIKELIANNYEPDYGGILKATFVIPFDNSETTAAFVKDSLMGLVFLALGSWGTLRSVGRQAAKPVGSFVRLQG